MLTDTENKLVVTSESGEGAGGRGEGHLGVGEGHLGMGEGHLRVGEWELQTVGCKIG